MMLLLRTATWLSLVLGCATHGAEVGDYKHLGVATCATGVCHGKLVAQKDVDVALNEYRIWSADDRHARAYSALAGARSKAIADKLGLASAQTAKICLDCHSDNVPADKRGAKFQISDGIACEACHGGAERWIESHSDASTTHADNIAKGLYPTENPERRAALCLDCHMGDADRLATHMIMGAGHPRLSFEVGAYTVNLPEHFTVDADYVRRKGAVDEFRIWLAGQLIGARRLLALDASPWFDKSGAITPELSLYDCQGCHHAMDDLRWSPKRAGGLKPGTLRLNDDHLSVLISVTGVLEPGERDALARMAGALLRAGQQNANAVREASRALTAWIDARKSAWLDRAYEHATVAAVRKAIVKDAAEGELADYGAAEQVYLAVDGLSQAIGDGERLHAKVDALWKTVETDRAYRPDQFAGAAHALLEAL